LDLYDFIHQGDNRADMRLQPGDVIVIPPAGARVAVLGTVNTPAIYELKGAEAAVSEVLGWGGGLPVIATTRVASLERIQPDAVTARSVTQIGLDAVGQVTRLRNGDMLSVYEISPKFENAVTLRGHVAAPLRYRFVSGMRIRDLIPERDALVVSDYYRRNNRLTQITGSDKEGVQQRVRNGANEVNWDYAVIERLNPLSLSTDMLPFNLGRAVIDADLQHNLELKAGDVVTIFSKNDVTIPQSKQTRLVNLEGEINAAGVYQLRPGETLRQVLARAGGLTPQAYVFGTEFTREETRRQQQERLDQATRRLEAMTASEATRQLSNVSGASSEQASQAQILQQQQQQQLARLKTLKSNGRIALELATTAQQLQDLPDLPLQDGDRIHIPARSTYVMAVGAVNNDNALIWKPGRTVEEVLALAGPTEAADMDSAFVLRADGTVLSRNQKSAWLFAFSSSGLDGVALMPGDAVVIPEKLDRKTGWTNFMVGLKDWTQILYQMGIGIAAWKTIQ
jgi:protein involved in polysaccharide export with SLBB domain